MGPLSMNADRSPTLWLWPAPLLLASGSATRRAMLQAAGIPLECQSPRVDERAIEADVLAVHPAGKNLAAVLAAAKCSEVSVRQPSRLVLGADQTLHCDGRLFHKPADAASARAQIAALAGRTHVLTSAFAIGKAGRVLATGRSTARLTMRPLNDHFISAYVDVAGPAVTSSVGAYQVEAFGAHLFARIEGDHFTILGLPLLRVLSALRRLGAVLAADHSARDGSMFTTDQL
jgi:septum formation protein